MTQLNELTDDQRVEIILDILTAHAGKPCPSIAELGRKVGRTDHTMTRLINCMAADGLIKIERMSRTTRRIMVTSTGKWTLPNCQTHQVTNNRPDAPMSNDDAGHQALVAQYGRFENYRVPKNNTARVDAVVIPPREILTYGHNRTAEGFRANSQ